LVAKEGEDEEGRGGGQNGDDAKNGPFLLDLFDEKNVYYQGIIETKSADCVILQKDRYKKELDALLTMDNLNKNKLDFSKNVTFIKKLNKTDLRQHMIILKNGTGDTENFWAIPIFYKILLSMDIKLVWEYITHFSTSFMNLPIISFNKKTSSAGVGKITANFVGTPLSYFVNYLVLAVKDVYVELDKPLYFILLRYLAVVSSWGASATEPFIDFSLVHNKEEAGESYTSSQEATGVLEIIKRNKGGDSKKHPFIAIYTKMDDILDESDDTRRVSNEIRSIRFDDITIEKCKLWKTGAIIFRNAWLSVMANEMYDILMILLSTSTFSMVHSVASSSKEGTSPHRNVFKLFVLNLKNMIMAFSNLDLGPNGIKLREENRVKDINLNFWRTFEMGLSGFKGTRFKDENSARQFNKLKGDENKEFLEKYHPGSSDFYGVYNKALVLAWIVKRAVLKNENVLKRARETWGINIHTSPTNASLLYTRSNVVFWSRSKEIGRNLYNETLSYAKDLVTSVDKSETDKSLVKNVFSAFKGFGSLLTGSTNTKNEELESNKEKLKERNANVERFYDLVYKDEETQIMGRGGIEKSKSRIHGTYGDDDYDDDGDDDDEEEREDKKTPMLILIKTIWDNVPDIKKPEDSIKTIYLKPFMDIDLENFELNGEGKLEPSKIFFQIDGDIDCHFGSLFIKKAEGYNGLSVKPEGEKNNSEGVNEIFMLSISDGYADRQFVKGKSVINVNDSKDLRKAFEVMLRIGSASMLYPIGFIKNDSKTLLTNITLGVGSDFYEVNKFKNGDLGTLEYIHFFWLNRFKRSFFLKNGELNNLKIANRIKHLFKQHLVANKRKFLTHCSSWNDIVIDSNDNLWLYSFNQFEWVSENTNKKLKGYIENRLLKLYEINDDLFSKKGRKIYELLCFCNLLVRMLFLCIFIKDNWLKWNDMKPNDIFDVDSYVTKNYTNVEWKGLTSHMNDKITNKNVLLLLVITLINNLRVGVVTFDDVSFNDIVDTFVNKE